MQAAQYAVDFSRQTLDADQQKLKVGLTTTTRDSAGRFVLTTSESNLVSAKAAYEKSRVELIGPPGCCWTTPALTWQTRRADKSRIAQSSLRGSPRQEAPAGGQPAPGGQL